MTPEKWDGQSTYRGPLLTRRAHRALASTLARKPNASCWAQRTTLPRGALKTGVRGQEKIAIVVVLTSGGFSSLQALRLSDSQHESNHTIGRRCCGHLSKGSASSAHSPPGQPPYSKTKRSPPGSPLGPA